MLKCVLVAARSAGSRRSAMHATTTFTGNGRRSTGRARSSPCAAARARKHWTGITRMVRGHFRAHAPTSLHIVLLTSGSTAGAHSMGASRLCSRPRVFPLRRLPWHFAFWCVHIGHNRLTSITHQHVVVLHRNVLPALGTVAYEHIYQDGKVPHEFVVHAFGTVLLQECLRLDKLLSCSGHCHLDRRYLRCKQRPDLIIRPHFGND